MKNTAHHSFQINTYFIDMNRSETFFRLINHTTKLLIKHHEKQLSFYVLNLLADYARTMQHKQILHWASNHEVDAAKKKHMCIVLIFEKERRKTRSMIFFLLVSNKVVV